jgi:hypothetical protein
MMPWRRALTISFSDSAIAVSILLLAMARKHQSNTIFVLDREWQPEHLSV